MTDDQSLLGLLRLEELTTDRLTSLTHVDDDSNLFGGELLAQALAAASSTIDASRPVHSLHAIFLRGGRPRASVQFQVHRLLDGPGRSARRVTVEQDGEVLMELSASFRAQREGITAQGHGLPTALSPEASPVRRTPSTMLDIDLRAADPADQAHLPARFWSRWTGSDSGAELTPALHACILAYVSDAFTGLFKLAALNDEQARGMDWTTLDHTMHFYHPAPADQWTLIDFTGESLSGGRGTYHGRFFSPDGTLLAGMSQESVFRRSRPLPGSEF